MAANGAASGEPEHKCCGVSAEEIQEKREVRRNKQQPWIVLKLAVFLTIAIIVYTWYVYVGRLCIPMIRRDAGALGSHGLGIGLLVVFVVLGLFMIWSYEKIVLTPPGFARDYVQKTPAPAGHGGFHTYWESESEAELAAARYGPPQQSAPLPTPTPPQSRRSESHHKRSTSDSAPRIPEKVLNGTASVRHHGSQNGHAPSPTKESFGTTDRPPAAVGAHSAVTTEKGHGNGHAQPAPISAKHTRRPPKTPVLRDEYRYCYKDGFLKPHRAHHCRACGTCVLKYDHHCPWIGQCVGARNHRFFYIFDFWAFLFCSFTFASLVGLVGQAASNRPDFSIDGQHIAIIVISGFFMIFTFSLLVAHGILIAGSFSTVEQMAVQRTTDREKRVMARLHSRWAFSARKATRKLWDAEWGRLGKEGHMWWLGGTRNNWEATMGDKVWMWFLPIGQSPDDGMSYVVNPRFDAEGRWLPRSEWPAELR
ncbi:zf-DHHC-domain-containing protein [Epithele typhae]|uniref:zf-DHHC-domain-containing protein n=1 Tax=Epithele typhae TaxID=378194 RepID=UPI002008B23E|nr:zf-DHHC-domain-containing protein [Epithele typhae]KAH9920836.1 zf-DHHC-domain-containing protein [Epithele typhae]